MDVDRYFTNEAAVQEVDRNTRFKNRKVKYWRKPDGWILLGPEISTDSPKYQQWREFGWRELPDRFGVEVAYTIDSTMLPAKGYAERDANRWMTRLIANGGLTYVITESDDFGKPGEYLITKKQLISMGFHKIKAVTDVRPDLLDVVIVKCPFGCPREFAAETQFEAEAAKNQHVAAVHREAVVSQSVGSAVASAIQSVMPSNQPSTAELISAVTTAILAALRAQGEQAMSSVATAAVAGIDAPGDDADGADGEQAEGAPGVPGMTEDDAFLRDIQYVETAKRTDLQRFAPMRGIKLPSNHGFMTNEQLRQFLKEELIKKYKGNELGNAAVESL